MKKRIIFAVLAVAMLLAVTGCGEVDTTNKAQSAEREIVGKQDSIYGKNQPIPLFDYSLPRDLWIQYYVASTQNVVRTWSCEVSDYGTPISEVYESVGYPIPADTQLTNPEKLSADWQSGHGGIWLEGTLPQSEPNGLYTSPNTNATIIMVADENGKVAPLYSEHKVQSWPFPVKWDEDKKIFVRTGKASLTLSTSGAPAK